MVLEAVVKDDGTLIAQAPDSLRGKRVKIIVKTGAAAKSRSKKLAQWENMTRALQDIDALKLPQREFEDILTELRAFRETL